MTNLGPIKRCTCNRLWMEQREGDPVPARGGKRVRDTEYDDGDGGEEEEAVGTNGRAPAPVV